jgi:cell division protein FtsL
MSCERPGFLPVWTLAVTAAASAFVVHLALRGRTVQLGYELGRTRQEQSRLREVKRVLELEAASYKTPERVEIVARTLLGMEPPPPERIVPMAVSPPVAVAPAGILPMAASLPATSQPAAAHQDLASEAP